MRIVSAERLGQALAVLDAAVAEYRVAALVGEGATLQLGIGAVPDAVLAALTDNLPAARRAGTGRAASLRAPGAPAPRTRVSTGEDPASRVPHLHR
jgi:hypothetical protein